MENVSKVSFSVLFSLGNVKVMFSDEKMNPRKIIVRVGFKIVFLDLPQILPLLKH